MRLVRFKVSDFRSVKDSGWVDTDAVSALIGVNESGKSNLLLPLWKLNPAREGEIQPTSDYPKKMFGAIREEPESYDFITAQFETGLLAAEIASKAGITAEDAAVVQVTRYFDGEYSIAFPLHERSTGLEASNVRDALGKLATDVAGVQPLKQETSLKETIADVIAKLLATLPAEGCIDSKRLTSIRDGLAKVVPAQPAKSSVIVPMVQQAVDSFAQTISEITAPGPADREGVLDTVISAMPKFVYYSNYGNLDSEIYLPQVVENLERTDLGAKEAAKARTLRVLFKFVRLEPKEILELGRDFKDPNNSGRKPTAEEIEFIAEAKRTRSILLQSASTKLTQDFKDWWKQGDYRFRFEADGNHFRIWVSDDRRPEEVELESRSTGLQWFLSFYLVFLVESLGEHKKAILLLDEPGMSLHPLAQRDLSAFFDSLSKTNQILYTSHSPFLVDADRLDRARKVYVAQDGTTKATPDLRYSDGDPKQAGAAYAVYSALNLSVAESLLLGCQPVLVEGASDQHYLTAIKALLIAGKRIAPARELVFPPSGGAKTARVVASMLTGRDERLPVVLLDDDGAGKKMAAELKSGLYGPEKHKVLNVADFIGMERSESEDLFPVTFLADVMDRMERRPEKPLSDVIKVGTPFVEQAEAWAKAHRIELEPHWKVELAKRVKRTALQKGIGHFDSKVAAMWEKLFSSFDVTDE